MMFIMEIYAIFTITIMMATLGLQQSCVNYCEITSDQEGSESRRDCNCTAISQTNLSKIRDASYESKIGEIDYETHKLNYTKFTEEKSFNAFIPKSVENENYNLNTNETLSSASENNFNSSLENYNLRHDNSSKPSKNIEFPIYLDVNLYRQGNDSTPNMKVEVINIFEKIRASEKDLSQCVNLQVYIFSKTNDNIQDDTNSGGEGNQNKLSRSEILTEIQNKCDQRHTVIHESIYEIRQREQKEYDSLQKSLESIENSSIYEADDTEDNRTIEDELSRTNHNIYQDSTDLENNDLLETTTISLDLIEEGDIDRHGMESHVPSLRLGLSATTESEEELLKLNMTFNRIRAPEAVSHIEIRDSIQRKGITRVIYSEKEILIPKIITKELSNNTVISIIDGYEIIPNTDFVLNYYDIARKGDNNFSSNETNASQSELSDISNIYNGNNTQSDVIQDLQGNFYFLFDNSQIPARFIQNSEGEMQLAVDGYSLCDQTTHSEDSQINFKNLLCSCIKYNHCSG